MTQTYFCPKCFKEVTIENGSIDTAINNIEYMSVNGFSITKNSSSLDNPRIRPIFPYEVICDCCDEKMLQVDYKLAGSIICLNKVGLKTVASSQGGDKMINFIGPETVMDIPYIEFHDSCNTFFIEMEDEIKSLLDGYNLTYVVDIVDFSGDDRDREYTMDINNISLKTLSRDENKSFSLTLTMLPRYIGSRPYYIPSRFSDACLQICLVAAKLITLYEEYKNKKETEQSDKDSSTPTEQTDAIKLDTTTPHLVDASDDEMDMF